MKNPLVSVIIPNYNYARYLGKRMESILTQTYQNFEIIILDDCSTDNSREVIEQYRNNPHVSQIVYNETNSGSTFLQWDRGISLAKGELCWICEADDFCRSTLLEKLVAMFEQYENVVLATCRTLLVDDNGKITQGQFPSKPSFVMSGTSFIKEKMLFKTYINNAGMAVFSRKMATEIAKQYLELKHTGAGDWMFWVEIAERGIVGIVNEPLNYCRRHEGTVTSAKEKDGSNNRARRFIFDYECRQGYISWYNQQIIKVMNCIEISNRKGLNDEDKTRQRALWKQNKLIYRYAYPLYWRRLRMSKQAEINSDPFFYSLFDNLIAKYKDFDAAARIVYNIN